MFTLEELGERGSPVHINKMNMTISELINMYVAPPEEVKMVISPKPDQEKEWTGIQKSRLIESIFLDLPIPDIFILDTGSGGMQLLDGRKKNTRCCPIYQFLHPGVRSFDLVGM